MNENISSDKKSSKKSVTADIVCIGLSAAIIAVCSQISIPATVPFTLQTFAVFTAAGLFGAKRGTLSVVVYILLGMIGIPVFAGFSGGISALLGTSGGYILGFIFSALIVGIVSDKCSGKLIPLAIAMIFGLAACYAFGTMWFIAVYTRTTGAVGLWTALGWCVFPFIIPDLVKIVCALVISNRVGKHIKF